MTQRQYEEEMKRIKKENFQLELKRSLREERFKRFHFPKLETSKLIAIYLLVLFNIILIYAGVAMWHFNDLTHLGVIISDIAGQILIYAIYCMKAFKSKKAEEDIKYKRDKLAGTLTDILEAGTQEEEDSNDQYQ